MGFKVKTATAVLSAVAALGVLSGQPAWAAGEANGSYVKLDNWAGYAAAGVSGAFTSVSASWTQPAVSCTNDYRSSSFWVGIDGYANSHLQQTGSKARCRDGVAEYYAWYEVLPASESRWDVAVEPGDHLHAEVGKNAAGEWVMTLSDSTRGWSRTQVDKAVHPGASAEVVAEAPANGGGIVPLADFGSVTFTDVTVNGVPAQSRTDLDSLAMVNSVTGVTKARTSELVDNAFTVTWRRPS
ncbi:G1 family glutamic endopeptidase [Amycolatopsis sp. NPDC004378]